MAKAPGRMGIAHSQLREFKPSGHVVRAGQDDVSDQGNDVRAAAERIWYKGINVPAARPVF